MNFIHSKINKRAFSLFILVIAFLLITSAHAKTQQTAPKVIVSSVKQTALIEEVPVSGSVISPLVAELALEVSGIIKSLAVDIGDEVNAGDELLKLDADLHRLSLAAARAASEQAREQLQDAKRRLNNFQALARQNTVSENELESLAAQVRIETAALEGFLSEEKRQQALLQRHVLRAPFSGVISRKYVEKGEWLQPGKAAFRLVSVSNLRIDLQLPQSIFNKLDQVTEIVVNLDSLPQQVFSGQIESVIPVTNPDSRTFLARIKLDNQQLKITPGMSVSAIIRLQQNTQGLAVSRDALMRYPDGRVSVWVIKQQNNSSTVTERLVQTGLAFDGKVAITQGLNGGEQVVIKGNEALREGQTVTVQTAD